MNRVVVVVAAMVLIAVVELVTFGKAPSVLLPVAAIPLALAVVQLTLGLRRGREIEEEEPPDDMENGPAEMLYRWHARAQMLADRAEGTRADWDRHLRPLLAKEFELSTGLRVAKNRKATEAAGILQFGPELWRWVDPANSALRDQTSRAPGRAALDEILRRLQGM
ncbi:MULTISPECIES: hypothetical protein [Nocardia]|uniref:hypothetical protein n=1 Tax=Nocardia TaxID=1817 RepID=UPI000D687819|nr:MULTISPECIES: hypothetical protein [Nocardia]